MKYRGVSIVAELRVQVLMDTSTFFRSANAVQSKIDQMSGKPVTVNVDRGIANIAPMSYSKTVSFCACGNLWPVHI